VESILTRNLIKVLKRYAENNDIVPIFLDMDSSSFFFIFFSRLPFPFLSQGNCKTKLDEHFGYFLSHIIHITMTQQHAMHGNSLVMKPQEQYRLISRNQFCCDTGENTKKKTSYHQAKIISSFAKQESLELELSRYR
jgi:hypothetical protein